ncbi:unnamed protein product [Ambrosiozyma monospora]|uniref:Unnamed protein product n=1 Tax=Ambrosiozyma monospora TaxID=43982 RepID=A0ACB5T4K0_AMBMO|nr:unnamed protein product [Ambrosiozyma monospora]
MELWLYHRQQYEKLTVPIIFEKAEHGPCVENLPQKRVDFSERQFESDNMMAGYVEYRSYRNYRAVIHAYVPVFLIYTIEIFLVNVHYLSNEQPIFNSTHLLIQLAREHFITCLCFTDIDELIEFQALKLINGIPNVLMWIIVLK